MSGPVQKPTKDLDIEAIGSEVYVEVCPECGLLHLGPVAPWHAYDCSEPDLVRYIARIERRADTKTAQT